MIGDLQTRAFGGEIDADICIVGGGAAGITIAHALRDSGARIVLLESGGETADPAIQDLCEGESVGHPMRVAEGRHRVLGGATSKWTGRCAKLAPIDFENRPWLDAPGWPIGAPELAPYYRRAEPICGFDQAWLEDAEVPRTLGLAGPLLDGGEVETFVWRYAPRGNRVYLNWGAEYREALTAAPNVQVLLNATVVALQGDHGGAVESVTVRGVGGGEAIIRAKAFVLCCGGIENARLLLLSELAAPGGVANRYDQVGRYFMQHPRGYTARVQVAPDMARRLQDVFNIFAKRGGLQYELGFSLAAEAQRREHLLNCSAILAYEADPGSGWESAKAAFRDFRRFLVSPDTVGRVGRAIAHADEIAQNAQRQLTGRHPILSTRAINLCVDLEQAPDSQSRVMLSDQLDALGQRRSRIDWRVSELERRTARYFTTQLAREFERAEIGHVWPEQWLFEDGAPMTDEQLCGTFHHLCTTRMSADPRHGVVDADCRVHGTSNLFAAGASVFATGGQANPTFTIVALALRLADHLRERYAAETRIDSVALTA